MVPTYVTVPLSRQFGEIIASNGCGYQPSVTFLAKVSEESEISIEYLVSSKEGIITDIIPAIKANKTLKFKVESALSREA